MLQSSSYASSATSSWSEGLDSSSLRDPCIPPDEISDDTVYSRESFIARESTPSPGIDVYDNSIASGRLRDFEGSETSDSAEVLLTTIRSFPPPSRPSNSVQSPPKEPSREDVKAKPQISAYCYDAFAEYVDPRESVDTVRSCSRADSLDLDPIFLGRKPNETSRESSAFSPKVSLSMLPALKDLPAGSRLHRTALSMPGSPLRNPLRSPKRPRRLSQLTTQASATDIVFIIGKAEASELPEEPSRSPEKTSLGLVLKRLIKRAPALARPASFNLSEEQHEISPFPCNSPKVAERSMPGFSDSCIAEAETQLRLPEYHRGLRKQACPPRVRYAGQEACHLESPRQASSLLLGSPRSAFDQYRPLRSN